MERDDHDEILRSRERLHLLEKTTQALVWKIELLEQTMKTTIAELKPVLASFAAAKQKRAAALRSLALSGRILAGLAATAVLFQTVWQATRH